MGDELIHSLRGLLSALPLDLASSDQVAGWQVEPVFGGANNRLFRAIGHYDSLP